MLACVKHSDIKGWLYYYFCQFYVCYKYALSQVNKDPPFFRTSFPSSGVNLQHGVYAL